MRSKASTLAGTWYPATRDQLARLVEDLLATARRGDAPTPVAALVVPHAGYRYSGRAAASAYAQVGATGVSRVVILAPSHYAAFRGAVVPDLEAFETPLGAVAVDVDTIRRLRSLQLVSEDDGPFVREHSLEIQLPFLQTVLPGVPIVPVLVGSLHGSDAGDLARSVAPAIDEATLVVVSSDFTHYGTAFDYLPFPPSGPARVKDNLAALDRGAIEPVVAGDAEGFGRYIARTGATVCGRMPISLYLHLRGGRGGGRLLSYYTSLDVTGDFEHTVSYAAIAFDR